MVTGAGAPIGEMLVRSLLDDSRVGHILAVTGHPVETFPISDPKRLTVKQVNLAEVASFITSSSRQQRN